MAWFLPKHKAYTDGSFSEYWLDTIILMCVCVCVRVCARLSVALDAWSGPAGVHYLLDYKAFGCSLCIIVSYEILRLLDFYCCRYVLYCVFWAPSCDWFRRSASWQRYISQAIIWFWSCEGLINYYKFLDRNFGLCFFTFHCYFSLCRLRKPYVVWKSKSHTEETCEGNIVYLVSLHKQQGSYRMCMFLSFVWIDDAKV